MVNITGERKQIRSPVFFCGSITVSQAAWESLL